MTLLDPRRLRAQVDLSSASAGRSRLPLTERDVNVPLGLQVSEMDPSSVSIRLKERSDSLDEAAPGNQPREVL